MFYKVETFSQKKIEKKKKFYTQREINNVKGKRFRVDRNIRLHFETRKFVENSSKKLELSESCKLFKFEFVTRTAQVSLTNLTSKHVLNPKFRDNLTNFV